MVLFGQRIDLFTLAASVLAMVTLAFVAVENGAAVVMCALCLGAVVSARFAGVPNRALVPLALGLAALLWMVWVDPPAGPRKTSALAHAAGGALLGWALAETLRQRLAWPKWVLAALAGVIAATVIWELGEWRADRLLDTALIPSKRDSAFDVFFGTVGGSAAILLAWVLARARGAG